MKGPSLIPPAQFYTLYMHEIKVLDLITTLADILPLCAAVVV